MPGAGQASVAKKATVTEKKKERGGGYGSKSWAGPQGVRAWDIIYGKTESDPRYESQLESTDSWAGARRKVRRVLGLGTFPMGRQSLTPIMNLSFRAP